MPLQRNINSWYNKILLHIMFLCQLTKLIDAEEKNVFPSFFWSKYLDLFLFLFVLVLFCFLYIFINSSL